MYKLVLALPLGITLVHRTSYPNVVTAEAGRQALPNGFQIVDEDTLQGAKVIEVPFKKAEKSNEPTKS